MDESQAMVVNARRMNILWDEFLAVMIQTLDTLASVHRTPWDIAGIYYHSFKFSNLTTQFLGGFWEKCAETLLSIPTLTHETVDRAMLIILSMWLVERLALDRSFHVLKVLFGDYADHLSSANFERLNGIVSDIDTLEDGLDDLRVALELRKGMLLQLESTLPALDNRLSVLINNGIDSQIYSCLSHNTRDSNALLCDHSCSEHHLPTKTIQILTGHDKNIGTVKFSHNGLYLASGSVDCTAIIWEVPAGWELRKKHVLRGHNDRITCVSWSPNDELLLTCALLENIKIWDVLTGQCTRVISTPPLQSSALLKSDPIEIVYGTRILGGPSIRLLRDRCDTELVSFPYQSMNVDFVATPDGRKLIYYDPMVAEEWLTVKDIETGHSQSFKEDASIRGISVSEDSELLILNLRNNEIHVWDLEILDDKPLTYWNFKQIIGGNSTCVGGVDSNFLVSGTQDSKVYIWNRRQARPVAILSGHTSVVRCVSWNPNRPQMLASAGDDSTIRIWGPQSQEVPQLFRHD